MWAPDGTDFSSDDGVLFVLSAWHELFYGFTPDSYQPRLHNVASLVDELFLIGSRWKSDARFAPHIKHVQDELCETIKAEAKTLDLIPAYRSRAIQLVFARSPDGVIAGASILSEDKDTYRRAFEQWARGAVSGLPFTKKESLAAIRGLASFAFQQGKEDDDVWDPEIASTAKGPAEAFEQLIQLASSGSNTYTCTLSIVGDVGGIHSIARKQGYRIVAAKSLPEKYVSTISTAGNRTIHIQLDIEASSIREAISAARKALGIEIGFVSLYTNPSELRIHSTALVSFGNKDREFLQTEQAFRRLFPRTHARRDIDNAIQLVADHQVDNRVLAAVEQMALASASNDTRTRFVNLWSALETLAGAHEGNNTLERVSELIVPLVTSRKVHKTTRYMTILCQKHAARIGSKDFGVGFKLKRGNIRVEDMLVTLASPTDDPKIVELLAFASHPLLRSHLYSTWQSLCNPYVLRDRLLQSRRRLEWHLARIYRARNLLVHEGYEVPHIVPLLDNLQNYVSMLVQRLVHELKAHDRWTVRHAIEYWISRMTHTSECLKSCPSCLKVGDFLETDDIAALWPHH